MVVNKRMKNSRQRGSWTHGWGAKKKHRGAGHRGGRGNAGSGKRADTKKPSIWKNKKYFGKHGFKKKNARIIKAINIKHLEQGIENLAKKGLVKESNGTYEVDLAKLGFNKLLGYGEPTKKFNIITQFSTQSAVEKIKSAGGDVSIKGSKKSPEAKEKSAEGKKEDNKEPKANDDKPAEGA